MERNVVERRAEVAGEKLTANLAAALEQAEIMRLFLRRSDVRPVGDVESEITVERGKIAVLFAQKRAKQLIDAGDTQLVS